jgi:hypothetical protein
MHERVTIVLFLLHDACTAENVAIFRNKNIVFDLCGDSGMHERGTAEPYRGWSTAVQMQLTSHQLVTAEELKRFRYLKNGAADSIFE